MAWYNPFSWKQRVTYENLQGTHTYQLNNPDFGQFVSCFRSANSDANVLRMFKLLPELFAPMDGIASRVCNGRFVVKRMSNDEVVYSKTALNKILQQPNPMQKWNDFVYNSIIYKLAGNRYIYAKVPSSLSFDYTNLTGLWLLMPQYTQPIPKSTYPDIFDITSISDLVDRYEVDWNGRTIPISPKFVIHDSPLYVDYTDADNPLKGISPIVADEYPMSNLCAVYEARNVIYVKRGALGAVVSKKGDASGLIPLTPGEKTQAREDFQDTYGLSHGKSTVAITALPVEWMSYAMSIRELEPFRETEASAHAIASSLRYPVDLLPSNKGATFENQKRAEIGLYQNVIIQEGKDLCTQINALLQLEQQGLYLDVTYDHIEVLQEDKKAEADTFDTKTKSVTLLYDKGFITKNTGLVMLGQEENPDFNHYSFNDPNKQVDQTIPNEQPAPQS